MHNLTIFAVAYKPKKKLIDLLVERYSKIYPTIIINNSLERLDDEFYKIKNLNVIDNKENRGNGAGINVGLKSITTKYALYIDLDSYISLGNLSKLLRYANLVKNFGVLIPNSSNKIKKKIYKTWNHEGSIMLFNLEVLENKLFDEKYFLYFEELDFFLNCLKKNINVFFVPKVISSHARGTSIIEDHKIEELRVWHYSWSQFYFYRKNFNFFYAIKKSLPNFLKSIFMIIPNLIKKDFKKTKLGLAAISGFTSSFLCLKSWKRIN